MDESIEKSISILREAKSKFNNLAILWSEGKDSTAMLTRCREAFSYCTQPCPKLSVGHLVPNLV